MTNPSPVQEMEPKKKLSDRVLELLNQSEDEPTFQGFVADLVDALELTPIDEENEIAHHVFTELGVSLFSIDKIVVIVSFHIIPENKEDGKIHPYTDELPFGVSVKDNRTTVQEKLGQPLQSVRVGDTDISESYNLEGWQSVFWYTLPDELLTEVRVMPTPVVQESDLEVSEPEDFTPPPAVPQDEDDKSTSGRSV